VAQILSRPFLLRVCLFGEVLLIVLIMAQTIAEFGHFALDLARVRLVRLDVGRKRANPIDIYSSSFGDCGCSLMKLPTSSSCAFAAAIAFSARAARSFSAWAGSGAAG